MARITAEERARKLNAFNDYIYKLFIKEGWSVVTYDRITKDFGLR
ncbi:hypothetical protein BCU00_001780 [Vibrio breoganii]|nr:hypothetical protein [Vibrio breoganii]